MPGSTNDVATGITLTFGTSGFTAELTSVSWSGISRVSLDTSHMGTAAPGSGKFGNMTFKPGDLSDPGELQVEFFFNPDTEPPIDQPAETITVTFPLVTGDTTAAKWAASGFITSYEMTGELENMMTGSMTVKFSGNVTQTAAA